MKSTVMIGALLGVLGAGVLVHPGITYTTHETVVDLGPLHATKETTKTIPLPPLLGGMVLVGGLVLMVLGAKRS